MPANPKKPIRFDKPEKTNWPVVISFWVFVIVAIGGCVWLWNKSPKMHKLECDDTGGNTSLTSFGSCHEVE